jgi:hypothetical protein
MLLILTQTEQFGIITRINKTQCTGGIPGGMISLPSFANIDSLLQNILGMDVNVL